MQSRQEAGREGTPRGKNGIHQGTSISPNSRAARKGGANFLTSMPKARLTQGPTRERETGKHHKTYGGQKSTIRSKTKEEFEEAKEGRGWKNKPQRHERSRGSNPIAIHRIKAPATERGEEVACLPELQLWMQSRSSLPSGRPPSRLVQNAHSTSGRNTAYTRRVVLLAAEDPNTGL